MDNLSSLPPWGYQQNQQALVELKDKLWATILELEEVKNIARAEIRKREDNINQLIQSVKAADQERDEAKDQLHMLLNMLAQPNSIEFCTSPPFQLRQPLASTSNITESENSHSHDSSTAVVDSFIADSCNEDGMAAVFRRFAEKPLPVKGRLLEAVMNAGPILDTLFVAGSLPQWRNPPPLKPLLVPPMPIRREDGYMLRQNADVNPSNYLLQNCNAASQATTASPMPCYGSGAQCSRKR